MIDDFRIDEIYRRKKIEEERRRFLAEDEKKRYALEQQNLQKQEVEVYSNPVKAPSSVFDGINQDEFTIKSHEAIESSLLNEGVEDIDENSEDEEEDEWNTPSMYY